MKPVLDRAGAPMIWVDALQGHLHWLPVTKLQIETFLCDFHHSHFDQKWYEGLINETNEKDKKTEPRGNGRVEPALILKDNYQRAFLTGIRPREVQDFVQWNNDHKPGECFYYMLTDAEWRAAYAELQARPAYPSLAHFEQLNIKSRMTTLLNRMQAVARELTRSRAMQLSEQMFLTKGVLEWVTHPMELYGGRGDSGGLGGGSAIESAKPLGLYDFEVPHRAYGFRLLRKES